MNFNLFKEYIVFSLIKSIINKEFKSFLRKNKILIFHDELSSIDAKTNENCEKTLFFVNTCDIKPFITSGRVTLSIAEELAGSLKIKICSKNLKDIIHLNPKELFSLVSSEGREDDIFFDPINFGFDIKKTQNMIIGSSFELIIIIKKEKVLLISRCPENEKLRTKENKLLVFYDFTIESASDLSQEEDKEKLPSRKRRLQIIGKADTISKAIKKNNEIIKESEKITKKIKSILKNKDELRREVIALTNKEFNKKENSILTSKASPEPEELIIYTDKLVKNNLKKFI